MGVGSPAENCRRAIEPPTGSILAQHVRVHQNVPGGDKGGHFSDGESVVISSYDSEEHIRCLAELLQGGCGGSSFMEFFANAIFVPGWGRLPL